MQLNVVVHSNNCSSVPGHYATTLCLFWRTQSVPAALIVDSCTAMMIKIPQHSWLAKDSRGVLTLKKLCTSLFYSAATSLNASQLASGPPSVWGDSSTHVQRQPRLKAGSGSHKVWRRNTGSYSCMRLVPFRGGRSPCACFVAAI